MNPLLPSEPETTVRNESLRKAALVLVSMDDAKAAELLSRMSPEQVEAITRAIENLNEIDPQEQQDALDQFQNQLKSEKAVRSSGGSRQHLGEDPTAWSPDDIRASFELGLTDLWAMALADCDLSTFERVNHALLKPDRKSLRAANSGLGPWRIDEPESARRKIHLEYLNFLSEIEKPVHQTFRNS